MSRYDALEKKYGKDRVFEVEEFLERVKPIDFGKLEDVEVRTTIIERVIKREDISQKSRS